MPKLASIQAGELGELLALAKLNSLGYAAYVSPAGAPGHDLIVVVNGKAKSVEVKTRQYEKRLSEVNRWPIRMKTKADADFVICVELNIVNMSPTFYVLNQEQARKTYNEKSQDLSPSRVRGLVSPNDFSSLEINDDA